METSFELFKYANGIISERYHIPILRFPLLRLEYHDEEPVLLLNFCRTAVRHLDFKFLFHINLSLCPREGASRGRIDTFPFRSHFDDYDVRHHFADVMQYLVDALVCQVVYEVVGLGRHQAAVEVLRLDIDLDGDGLLLLSLEDGQL